MGSPLISIIDDDEAVRLSFDSLVRSLGWRVASFPSAEAFLESETSELCDCVVSDVQLPGGMTGVELGKVLARGRHVPLILISGRIAGEGDKLAREASAVSFLRKPFTGSAMIDCLSAALAA